MLLDVVVGVVAVDEGSGTPTGEALLVGAGRSWGKLGVRGDGDGC